MNAHLKHASTPAFFEAKYRLKADPWLFSSKRSEQKRYDTLIAALSHRRYARALEPGCSIGVLTEKLAGICDAVEAVDFSATAAEKARARCAHLKNVTVKCLPFREVLPAVGFDLVVLSEIGYYFSKAEWRGLLDQMVGSLEAGTIVLAAHWLGTSVDHALSGDEVHEVVLAHGGLEVEHTERHRSFRLERLVVRR